MTVLCYLSYAGAAQHLFTPAGPAEIHGQVHGGERAAHSEER